MSGSRFLVSLCKVFNSESISTVSSLLKKMSIFATKKDANTNEFHLLKVLQSLELLFRQRKGCT